MPSAAGNRGPFSASRIPGETRRDVDQIDIRKPRVGNVGGGAQIEDRDQANDKDCKHADHGEDVRMLSARATRKRQSRGDKGVSSEESKDR